jgi:hypothetical protein
MYRRVTRVAKQDYEIMDEIVEAIMHGLTPEQIRKELEDRIYAHLESLPQHKFEEEMENYEISGYHEPQEPEE